MNQEDFILMKQNKEIYNQISIGISDRKIVENKAYLGLNFEKGNWGILSTGFAVEEGYQSKKRLFRGLEKNDIVTVNFNKGIITLYLNYEKIKYEYDFNSENFKFLEELEKNTDKSLDCTNNLYFGVSLSNLDDKVSIV